MASTHQPLASARQWQPAQVGAGDDLILEILAKHYRAALTEIQQVAGSWRPSGRPWGDPKSRHSPRMTSLDLMRAERAADAASPGLSPWSLVLLVLVAAAIAILLVFSSPSTWFRSTPGPASVAEISSPPPVASVPFDPWALPIVEADAPSSASFAVLGGASLNRVEASLNGPAGAGLADGPLSTQEALIYTIQPGDTLLAIAARFGTTKAALVELNDFADPGVIIAGQDLIVR
ncbi:MAG: LysM domain-containing protein [Chloroflexi bacterium]|nr:LysM domain-containing protein [Chloroflexota bacterium]